VKRTLVALALLSSTAHAKLPPKENTPALISLAVGALTTVVGAILVGYSSTIRVGGNCPAYPMNADTCGGMASDYRISGWTLFGAGLTISLGGGVALGVQAR
jgi:hypothetical protein